MPRQNQFRHQPYPTEPSIRPVRQILSVDPGAVDFGRLHTRHAVREVVLVPGTFAGDDPFNIVGTLRSMADRLPAGGSVVDNIADRVAEMTQGAVNRVADDVGNYSDEFVQRFEELVGGDPHVSVLSPAWTGQNHHAARADLAVRLLNDLDSADLHSGEQVLLWGHSHAGNGFALLSNLLANHRPSVEQFFEACGYPEQDHWRRAHDILRSDRSPHPLARHVTAVTFGTPVRYGWDTDGLHGLYHVLFDRSTDDGTRITTQPVYPPHTPRDMMEATWGDWVQAFAIEGTDVVPPAPGPLDRDREIAKLLLNGLQPPELTIDTRLIPVEHLQHLCARWKTGTRCHADGHNLLVDYVPGGRELLGLPVEHSVFGHGVATTTDWLPAHLNLLLKRMDLTLG